MANKHLKKVKESDLVNTDHPSLQLLTHIASNQGVGPNEKDEPTGFQEPGISNVINSFQYYNPHNKKAITAAASNPNASFDSILNGLKVIYPDQDKELSDKITSNPALPLLTLENPAKLTDAHILSLTHLAQSPNTDHYLQNMLYHMDHVGKRNINSALGKNPNIDPNLARKLAQNTDFIDDLDMNHDFMKNSNIPSDVVDYIYNLDKDKYKHYKILSNAKLNKKHFDKTFSDLIHNPISGLNKIKQQLALASMLESPHATPDHIKMVSTVREHMTPFIIKRLLRHPLTPDNIKQNIK